MKAELQWIIVSVFAFTIVVMGAMINIQQGTIESLIISQQVETARAAAQHREIASLHREVLKLTDKLEYRRDWRQLKVEKQTDLLAAASRSGWRGAERLLRSAEFRDELGQ